MVQKANDFFKQVLTSETDEQELISVNHNKDISVVVTGGNVLDNIDLEFTLDNPNKAGVTRIKESLNILAGGTTFIDSFNGPVTAVGIDIKTNISNNITLTVLQGGSR